MPNPENREIVRNFDGGWDARGAHVECSSKHAETQAAASHYAKGVVRNARGGEARSQGRNGCSPDSNIVAPASGSRPSGT